MRRVFYAIATISAIAALAAQASAASRVVSAQPQAQPRLVVGIVVDQLRSDKIEELQAYFGTRGFKTLLEQGAYLRDVDFGKRSLDPAAATAMIHTGAYPSQTGVPSAMVPDPENPSGALTPALAAGKATLTNDSFTPEGLRLSTLSDEIAIDRQGNATIYSVAIDPQQAVILAGHAGNGAIWLNNTSGNWATTSYYGALPTVVSNRNFRNSVAAKIDTIKWQPLAETAAAAGITDRKQLFRHQFSHSDRDVYKKFAASAPANREITDVAIDLLRQLEQTGSGTDVINIAYSVAPFKYGAEGSGRMEQTDSYLRLDRQLGRLLDAIDRYAGPGNAVVWLSGTGSCDEAVVDEKRYRLPGGEFSVKRARSLLNSYLSARHGAAGYVEAIKDRNVYFNKKAIEERHLDAEKVIADARSFLSKMSGVADALLLNDVLSPATEEARSLRNVTDPRVSGDILLEYIPGWKIVDDEQYPPTTKTYRLAPALTPAFIIAPGVASQEIDTPVAATALAPTVAGILRCRSPNGTRSRSISLKHN